jgi:hypothetical protein
MGRIIAVFFLRLIVTDDAIGVDHFRSAIALAVYVVTTCCDGCYRRMTVIDIMLFIGCCGGRRTHNFS